MERPSGEGGTSGAERGGGGCVVAGEKGRVAPLRAAELQRRTVRPAAAMPGIDKLPIEETLEDSPQVREAGSGPGVSAGPSAAPRSIPPAFPWGDGASSLVPGGRGTGRDRAGPGGRGRCLPVLLVAGGGGSAVRSGRAPASGAPVPLSSPRVPGRGAGGAAPGSGGFAAVPPVFSAPTFTFVICFGDLVLAKPVSISQDDFVLIFVFYQKRLKV